MKDEPNKITFTCENCKRNLSFKIQLRCLAEECVFTGKASVTLYLKCANCGHVNEVKFESGKEFYVIEK